MRPARRPLDPAQSRLGSDDGRRLHGVLHPMSAASTARHESHEDVVGLTEGRGPHFLAARLLQAWLGRVRTLQYARRRAALLVVGEDGAAT